MTQKLRFLNAKSQDGSLDISFLEYLKSIFTPDIFIETGTYLGDSAITAAKVFKQVHTIELSNDLYLRATERLNVINNVCCYLGDSAEVMKDLLPKLSGRALFWLDGHYSGGITSRGANNTPILKELEAIRLLPSKEAVILIDDLRLFQSPKLGFKNKFSLQKTL